MIFRILGHAVCRAWFLLLAFWAVVVLAAWLSAPRWNDVAQDKEFAFLPENAPSRRAEEVYAKAFPDDRLTSSIVLVLYQADGRTANLDAARKFIDGDLEPGLRQIADAAGGLASEVLPSEEPLFANDVPQPAMKPQSRSIMSRIRTPSVPGSGALLVSPDQQALLVVVELTTEFLARENWPVIDKVQRLIDDLRQQGKLPAGLDIAMTGSAMIGRDHSQAELDSIRATGTLTILLVISLLILIYRAPLLALIPLATVYLAVEVSIHVLSILARAGNITLFQGIQIYITILAYGAGVDYCLFLMARYKEELDHGAEPAEALDRSVRGVGAALTASAATVMCGIGMMIFAQFGKFREAGYAIPLSLAVVLIASLTFSPALLRVAGCWAFWPQKIGRCRKTPRQPAQGFGRWFRAGELERIWDCVGQLLQRRAGTVWLATVAVMAPFAVLGALCYGWISFDLIGDLPSSSPSVAGTRLLQQHFSAGMMGPVTVLLVNPKVDFSAPQGRDVVKQVTQRLRDERDALDLTDIRSLTQPLGITEAAQHPFAGFSDLPEEARKEGAQRAALQHYVTDLGERAKIGTRLELVLGHSPFSHRSMADLGRLEKAVPDALPAELRHGSEIYFTGTTASVRDLAGVMQSDRTRIELLVLASVFVILLLLLHRFVISLYLLLSVLFSYYTTLGVAFAVFWALDPHGFTGIDWKVAIFLFTILIAVGEDYNIFLMTRIDEEEGRHGPLRGITCALDRTGPIISSCGIIMAGTFASLVAGTLVEMKQLGFALTFGVLLDTFVVRPVLVPAFLILLRGGRLPLLSGWIKDRAPTPTGPYLGGNVSARQQAQHR